MQGTLAALDSKNPVMYLDFPQGRYKLFGELLVCVTLDLVPTLGLPSTCC